MAEDITDQIIIHEPEESPAVIIEGLPPLRNGVLETIPDKPYSFTATVTTHDSDGKDPDLVYFGLKVVLAHGVYDPATNTPHFLDNNESIDSRVGEFNNNHPSGKIELVVACMGSQPAISENEEEGKIFTGPADLTLSGVAFAQGTDLDVRLVQNQDGQVNMNVSYKSEKGGIVNWQFLEDHTSEAMEKKINLV